MIQSNIYLYAAYLFVLITLLALTGFYVWRNIALSRKISRPHKNSINLLLLLPFLGFIVLAAIIFFYLTSLERQEGFSPTDIMVGQRAPRIELPILTAQIENEIFTTSDLAGRVTLINFWASWCAPCRLEHPILMQLAQDGRFDLVGINYKDVPENALNFLNQFGNPFTLVAADRRGRAAIEWGVLGAPETYLVDRQGMISYRHIGPVTMDVLEQQLLPALTAALQ